MGWRVEVVVTCHGEPYLTTSFFSTPITIGAHPENDLVLDDSIVSGKHAVVMISRNQLIFRDQSTNGSFFQGRRIEEDTALGSRGTISIPPFELELAFESQADATDRKTQYHRNLADLATTAPKAATEPPASPSPPAGPWAAPSPAEPPMEAPVAPQTEAPVAPRTEAPAAPRMEAPAEPPVEALAAPRMEAPAAPRMEAPAEPLAAPPAEPPQVQHPPLNPSEGRPSRPRSTRPVVSPPPLPASEPAVPQAAHETPVESPTPQESSGSATQPAYDPPTPSESSGSPGLPVPPATEEPAPNAAPLVDPAAGTLLSPGFLQNHAPALLHRINPDDGPVPSEIPLPARTVRLGRSESADVRLPDRTISRLHATVSPAGEGTFLVTDLDSSNGTFVNQRRIQEVRLQEGDEVRFGELAFRFHLIVPATPPEPVEPEPPSPLPFEQAPAQLDIEIEELAGASEPIYRVAIRGRVDTHHYTELSDALDGAIEDGARFLLIDLSQVDYVSPTGLGVLVKCLTRLQKRRGDLRLVGLDQRLRDALSLSRVDTLFKGRIAETQEQALQEWLGD